MLLALDTANKQCAACLYDDAQGKVLSAQSLTIGRGHAEHLLPLIQAVLDEGFEYFGKNEPLNKNDAPNNWQRLTKIAVNIGPGSFTGLRVGVSVARAAGCATNIPTFGISCFDSLMAEFLLENPSLQPASLPPALLPIDDQTIFIAQDARRGEIFFQGFRAKGKAPAFTDFAPIDSPQAKSVEAFFQLIQSGQGPILILGSANSILQHLDLPPHVQLIDQKNKKGAGEINIKIMARLAAQKAFQGQPAKPLYIRAADAKPQASPLSFLSSLSALAPPNSLGKNTPKTVDR